MCLPWYTEDELDDPPPSPRNAENGPQDHVQPANQQDGTQNEERIQNVPTDIHSRRSSRLGPLAYFVGSKKLVPA